MIYTLNIARVLNFNLLHFALIIYRFLRSFFVNFSLIEIFCCQTDGEEECKSWR